MPQRGEAIVLIGFMGAGKSSVGRRLAEQASLPRFDIDELVAVEFGLSVARIFELHGESVFRDAETATLRKLQPDYASIVVTGGGILLRPGNADLLQRLGFLVYLSADEETLFERASRKGRPLLQSNDPRRKMKELLEARTPLYQKAADVIVDTSHLNHDEVTDLVLRKLEKLKER